MAEESDMQLEEDKDNDDAENRGTDNGGVSNVVETIEDESEDEDVDFNPFLKGSPSEEASSSLSSEVEVLDADVVDSHSHSHSHSRSRSEDVVVSTVEGVSDRVGRLVDDECKEDEELGVSHEQEEEEEQAKGTVEGIENGSVSGTRVVVNDSSPVVDFDEEDAICRRTRARYSLASFTLDELETFLQETDDDDDFQNVDEEEEYRKFLAAVLKGGDGDDQGNVEGIDEDDDDEDNDADFEIEIQEALESDADDCVITSHNDEELETSGWRPKTRHKGRQKTTGPRKKGVKMEKRPLLPLVPIMFRAPDASVPCLGGSFLINPSHTQSSPLTGFVDHQIGQLYGLIYEHVQLLIQVYSLCVLEPARQHIAAQVKGLLSELLHKRDLVLAWRNVAYPTSCFDPQYVNSISDGSQNWVPFSGVASDGNDGQGCRCLPPIDGPVLSVLDVKPLKLAGNYISDVSNAVREHQKRCLETTNHYLERQPLFAVPACASSEVNCDAIRGDDPTPDARVVSPNDKLPKKSLAATLVESTKKQPVALVPQQIAELAQPFFPLFNSALFPHKPPLSAVANRVLFTDAEDVLLAMGIMEYNNNWKPIQQRFLPCKTEHQIFIRAKNRCSSKAPDNPIKAVRKLKTSPLTEDEKARIKQGLETFKRDWTLVWRAVVPYRDPNLLPRQWRSAAGTQKSYKLPSGRKEKHRIAELNRRRRMAAAMDNSHTVSEKEDNQIELCGRQNVHEKDGVDNGNEAYVHEAFLADWRPIATGVNAQSNRNPRCLPGEEVSNNHGNRETQSVTVASESSHHVNRKSFHAYMSSGFPSNIATSKSFGCESHLHSLKARKHGISNVVKLGPDLPPMKLPPAVRVISQASLRSSQLVCSSRLVNPVSNTTTIDCAVNVDKHVHDKTSGLNSNSASVSSQKGETLNNRSVEEDKDADIDPQMHPLLYRSLEEGNVQRFSATNSSRIPTFSFFPAFQHQMSGNLLQNSHLPGPKSSISKEIASTSSSLDFHPLLQRTSDLNPKSFGTDTTSSPLTIDLELSRDRFVEELTYRAETDAAQVAAASKPASPNTDGNDLDLRIHLSSSRKRKVSSHEGTENNPMDPSVTIGNLVDGPKESATQHVSHDRTDLTTGENTGKLSSGNSTTPLEQPLLEIVMEHEELSDSDEEMEDVEFECEEMTDSDGEDGSAEDQMPNTKHKERGKNNLATDKNAQCPKSGTCDGSKGSRAPRKKRTSRADLGRLGKGPEGPWLSLNSRESHPIERAGRKSTKISDGVILDKSHSKRHSKKARLSRKKSSSEQKSEPTALDTLRSTSRKQRKQVIKTTITSTPDVTILNASCTENAGKV